MKKIHFSTGKLAFLFTFSICSISLYGQWGPGETGNGNVKEESRDLSGFTAIAASHGVDVYISQGSTGSVKVKADENLLDNILTKVEDGVLYMKVETPVRQAKTLAVYVTMNDLRKIKGSGGSDIYVEGKFRFSELEIAMSGGSDLYIKDMEAQHVNCITSGGSDTHLAGRADKLMAEAQGGSDIKAKDLVVKSCKVKAHGGSDAVVHVTGDLEAEAHGASDVIYYGSPKVLSQKSYGASDIISKDH